MAAWQKGSSWLSPPHPVQHGADEGERGAGTEGQKPAPLSSWLGLVPAWILTSFQVNVRHAKKHGCHMERAIVALAEDLGCQVVAFARESVARVLGVAGSPSWSGSQDIFEVSIFFSSSRILPSSEESNVVTRTGTTQSALFTGTSDQREDPRRYCPESHVSSPSPGIIV